MDLTDTIVATSSPAGRSLRAIVRLSGPDAVRIAAGVFESTRPLDKLRTYSSADGALWLARERIRCPATAYVMLAPRSYTREDVVELHTVGAPPLLGALVDALVAAGARPAEPGEFTRRAFLNGRIDLTQAEAVQGVIQARSEAELRASQAQLAGAFRTAVESLRSRLVELLAEVEAAIDFVDQDIALIERSAVRSRIAALLAEFESLAASEPAAVPADGVAAAICGLPNAGKSSLLNALAGEDRAIVTHLPGTTRDTVEHAIEIDGVAFRLIDTAGMRRRRPTRSRANAQDQTSNIEHRTQNVEGGTAEQEPRGQSEGAMSWVAAEHGRQARDERCTPGAAGTGSADAQAVERAQRATEAEAVERAQRAAAAADLVLLVIDGSKRLSAPARALWEQMTGRPRAAVLTVINKSDLGCRIAAAASERLARRGPVVQVSALTGDGLDALRAAMAAAVRSNAVDRSTHGLWLNARHRAALLRSSEALANARAALDGELGLEFAAADLRAALAPLGDVVGATTPDDILDAIFARFCIGK